MKRTFVALLVGASLLPLAGPSAAAAPSVGPHPAVDVVPGRPGDPKAPGAAGRPVSGPPRDRQVHFEYVPRSESEREAADNGGCSRASGPFQRQAERYLRRAVDGRQSTADCRAIQQFQRAHRIAPATGFAGPVTGAMVRLMRAQRDPNRAGHCPDHAERTVCVDLDRQLMWVQQNGRVLFDPVAIRTGYPGQPTRTGTFRIYLRSKAHVSNLYHSPMPYAQFFDHGEALHGVYDDLYEGDGSHGCVNLTWSDARRLWDVLKKGDIVHVWGRKPTG
ncbi:L,D-transpeptidase [Streptomyces sp. NPDC048506]|uniref:L,D-transpeptidase family protein n=1 Tax=Streptomyces sp. NPDC048506 TaxID=3155028 RepID=UPI0034313048